MSEQVQLRRGNTSVNNSFVGAQGELVADTQANILILHDGFTSGGHPIPSKAYVDTLVAAETGNVTFSGNTISAGTNETIYVTPNGSGIVQISSNISVTGNIKIAGITVINSIGIPILTTYTTTSLPILVTGGLIYVSDASAGNGTVAFGNSTAWIDIKTGLGVSV